jgi:hypothetical protein
MALAIFAAAAVHFDLPQVLRVNNLVHLFEQPLGAMIGIPLLTYQLGYFNILPLYAVLLLATPLFLLVGLSRPRLLLPGSIVVWLTANQFGINFPNYPTRAAGSSIPSPGNWFSSSDYWPEWG